MSSTTDHIIPKCKIMLRVARGFKFKDLDSILYIKSTDKSCEIYNCDGTVETVFHSLKEMEERLCCGTLYGCFHFLRIHKQYIAAIHYAEYWDTRKGLLLESGKVLPVSTKRIKDLKYKLLTYFTLK